MALGLNNLRAPKGATHKKKRIGRGPGSGTGKTAGRGEKGQKSRSGYSAKIGFEGGQMPLHRRLPKRGFTNIFKKEWIEVSLSSLDRSFGANEEVTPELLHERGLIKKAKRDVVVLGTGEISKALRISAHRFTKSAREKIEQAGGAVTLITRESLQADQALQARRALNDSHRWREKPEPIASLKPLKPARA